MIKRKTILKYYILSAFVIAIYCFFSVMEKSRLKNIIGLSRYNLVSYILMLFLILLSTIVLYIVDCRVVKKEEKCTEVQLHCAGSNLIWLAVALFFCFFAFLYILYCKETSIFASGYANSFIRNRVSKPAYAFLVSLAFALFVSLFLTQKSSLQHDNIIRAAVSIFFALLCAICVYAPNPFLDKGGMIHHVHAYDNSIINVANLHPFDEYNVSIYGHYGLLYLPFVKILGNDYAAIIITISLFTFISFACAFYVCGKWIRNDFVYIISIFAICAIPMMVYQEGQYFQLVPHRLLFPSVTLFMITRFLVKNINKRAKYIEEITVSILAITWNLETGIISTVVFCVFNMLFEIEDRNYKKGIIRAFAKCGMLILGCFIGSYLIVNIYSFLTGSIHWMSISRFIYPMDNQSYKIGYLRTDFCTVFSVFVVQLVIFSCAVLNYLCSLKNYNDEYRKTRMFLLCAAVSGFGAASYFANRTAWASVSISWIQMILVMGIFADEGQSEFKKIVVFRGRIAAPGRIAGKMAMLLYMFVFAFEGCLGFDGAIRQRLDTTWDTKSFIAAKTFCEEELPEDCFAIGKNIPELMFSVHKDCFPVLTDWSDMNELNLLKARNEIEEACRSKRPILLGPVEDYYEYLLENGYTQSQEITIGPVQYILLKYRDSEQNYI